MRRTRIERLLGLKSASSQVQLCRENRIRSRGIPMDPDAPPESWAFGELEFTAQGLPWGRVRDRAYYEDQTGWSAPDYYALWRYFSRLAEYVGSTPAQAQNPEHRSALIQAKKTQVRDEELPAIDMARIPAESRSLRTARRQIPGLHRVHAREGEPAPHRAGRRSPEQWPAELLR